MGLISEYVEVGLSGKNIKYYESLGYEIPKEKDEYGTTKIKQGIKIKVKIKDLQKGSGIKVKVKCDNPACRKEYETEYKTYLKHNHDGKTYCKSCVKKVFNSGINNPNYGGKYTKRGKDSPNWNLNLSQEEREQGRNYPEYIEFIKKVLARDNYTCQCCGDNKGGNLNVHHLDGYNWCVEKRTDETNGITLCETCHKNFHLKYDYGNNTKEQFEEWYGEAVESLKYKKELPIARKIYCIEENRIYNNAKECAEYFNLKAVSEIYKICNHTYGRNVCKNKHLLWYDEYINMTEEDIRDYLLKYKDKNSPKKVYQYDKDYTLIKIWNSTNEPKKLGYNYGSSNISVHCKNGKIYKGCYWSYNLIPKK